MTKEIDQGSNEKVITSAEVKQAFKGSIGTRKLKPIPVILTATLVITAVLVLFFNNRTTDPPTETSLDTNTTVNDAPENTTTITTKSENLVSHVGKSFTVFKVNFTSTLSSHLVFESNNKAESTSVWLKAIAAKPTPQNAGKVFPNNDNFFAITGAMYSPIDFLPPGLVISQGNKIKELDINTSNPGNFYLQPNGVLHMSSQSFGISKTSDFEKGENYQFALQSGPLLVADGVINAAFDSFSQNKTIRCGVGVVQRQGEQELVFVISRDKVNFYELADLFRTVYKCQNALHLDSGVFPFIHFPGSTYPMNNNIIRNLVVIK